MLCVNYVGQLKLSRYCYALGLGFQYLRCCVELVIVEGLYKDRGLETFAS